MWYHHACAGTSSLVEMGSQSERLAARLVELCAFFGAEGFAPPPCRGAPLVVQCALCCCEVVGWVADGEVLKAPHFDQAWQRIGQG